MKYIVYLLIGIFSSFYANAGAVDCGDKKVQYVIADTPYCTGEVKLAFRLESFSQWFCVKSNIGASLILSAKARESVLRVQVESPDNTCQGVPHYTEVNFIWEL